MNETGSSLKVLIVPEALRVPEVMPVSHPRLANLAIRLSREPDLSTWLSEEGVVYRDVLLNGEIVGGFDLRYDYDNRQIRVDNVGIDPDDTLNLKGKGIGRAMYSSVLELPLPCGNMPIENDFTFGSDHQSHQARRVWEGFVRRGEATKGFTVGRYRMHYPQKVSSNNGPND